MAITVHFRGVALLVADKKKEFITEVLFPRADKDPPDEKSENIPDPANPGETIRVVRHADGSPANAHFAGALFINKDLSTFYRLLIGRRVELSGGGGGNGASIGSPFQLPFLNEIIKPAKKLKLKKGRTSSTVSTQFRLKGGSIVANTPALFKWAFVEPDGTASPRTLSLEATWTIPDDEVELVISELDGGGKPERIKLNADCPTVYFYNFDNPMPIEDELKADNGGRPGIVDHDFKWIYKLLKNNETSGKWPDWLTRHFPAPQRSDDPLLPVSTCFEAVWNGDNE
jgi:hypothetical protein